MRKTSTALVAALAIFATVMNACVAPTGEDIGTVSSAFSTTEGACGHKPAPLLNDIGLNVGGAVISNTPTDLVINLNSNTLEGWSFNEILIYTGTGPVPYNAEWNSPDFTKFNYLRSYYPGTTSHTATISLLDLVVGDACGANINISIYVRLSKVDANGNVVETTAGWGYGSDFHACGCYGVSFPYTVCCAPTTGDKGCTRTQGYWKNHHEFAKNKNQKINWPAPLDERALLCTGDNRPLLGLLTLPPKGGNAYLILAHQYIAASLNVAAGASTNEEVDHALAEAKRLIDAYCGQTVKTSTADGQLMVIVAGVLDAYNNGNIGPGHCK